MTEQTRVILKDLNKNYFDKHVDEVRWSQENMLCTITMDTGEIFTFRGEEGKLIYKRLGF